MQEIGTPAHLKVQKKTKKRSRGFFTKEGLAA